MMEFIDGPVEEVIDISRSAAYSSFVQLTSLVAANLAGDMQTEIGGEGPRIISWVENPDSRFGHALIFSKPGITEDETKERVVKASLLKLDREEHVQVEEPKTIEIPLDPTTERTYEYYLDIFDKFPEDEVRLTLAMIKKAYSVYLVGHQTMLDGDVQLALVEENLDQLAEMYGDNKKQDEAKNIRLSDLLKTEEVKAAFSELYANGFGHPKFLAIYHKDNEGLEYLLRALGSNSTRLNVGVTILNKGVWLEDYQVDFEDPETGGDNLIENPAILNQEVIMRIIKSGKKMGETEFLYAYREWSEKF